MSGERIHPFPNGSAYDDWFHHNCARCRKHIWEPLSETCKLDYAIGEAYILDGTIDAFMAQRLGITDHDYAPLDCPERCLR